MAAAVDDSAQTIPTVSPFDPGVRESAGSPSLADHGGSGAASAGYRPFGILLVSLRSSLDGQYLAGERDGRNRPHATEAVTDDLFP